MVTSVESAARIMGRILQAVILSQRTRFACRKCTSQIKLPFDSLKGSMLIPILCRCGHEFGFECLSSWLSPNEGKNSCPTCRHELFLTAPNVPPSIDEILAQVHDEHIEGDWFDIATSIHSALSASGIVHRSPTFRDWLLYSQLQAQDSSLLTPWHPSSIDDLRPGLNFAHEEALFQELRRRRAFRVLPVPVPVPVGSLASERQIWNTLREQGYFYDPLYPATATGCAWTRI